MKKIGNVLDNYKVKMFEEELTAEGFEKWDKLTFKPGLTLLKIEVPDDKVINVQNALKRVNDYYGGMFKTIQK